MWSTHRPCFSNSLKTANKTHHQLFLYQFVFGEHGKKSKKKRLKLDKKHKVSPQSDMKKRLSHTNCVTASLAVGATKTVKWRVERGSNDPNTLTNIVSYSASMSRVFPRRHQPSIFINQVFAFSVLRLCWNRSPFVSLPTLVFLPLSPEVQLADKPG